MSWLDRAVARTTAFAATAARAVSSFASGPVATPPAPTPAKTVHRPFTDASPYRSVYNGHEQAHRVHATYRRIRTRWVLGDEERALYLADAGNLWLACQLINAMQGDGVISSLLRVRSNGLIRLPVQFTGDPNLCRELEGDPTQQSDGLFWSLAPPGELARIVRWGIMLGAGIGQIVDEDGSGNGVLRAVDMHHVRVDTVTDQLYFQGDEGDVEIIPGDGRWFAYFPYGRHRFWLEGAWLACAEAWLAKREARLQRNAYGRRLAGGIIHIDAPHQSTERDRVRVKEAYANLTEPPIFVFKKSQGGEAWETNVHEAGGQGFQSWRQERDDANMEIMIALKGEVVTTMGTTGFSKGDVNQDVAHSFVEDNAKSLTQAVHECLLMPLAERRGALATWATWISKRPEDKRTEGEALGAFGNGLDVANKALMPYGQRVALPALVEQNGVAVEPVPEQQNTNAPIFAYHIDEGVVSLNEVRKSLGLPYNPKLGDMTGPEFQAKFGSSGEDAPADVTAAALPALRVLRTLAAANTNDRLIRYKGLPILIETAEGEERTGTDSNGTPWRVTMKGAGYGCIPGTRSADGEDVDCYFASNPVGETVYVVGLKDGEHKLMVGFADRISALATLLAHMPRPDLIESTSEVPISLLASLAGDGPVQDAVRAIIEERKEAA